MEYQEPTPITREEAVRALDSGGLDAVCEALVRCAFHDQDWEWVQEQCMKLARHESAEIRSTAAGADKPGVGEDQGSLLSRGSSVPKNSSPERCVMPSYLPFHTTAC